jgi:hypothetical protein
MSPLCHDTLAMASDHSDRLGGGRGGARGESEANETVHFTFKFQDKKGVRLSFLLFA